MYAVYLPYSVLKSPNIRGIYTVLAYPTYLQLENALLPSRVQGEVDERKLAHAASVAPMVQSLAQSVQRGTPPATPSRGRFQRFAFLSTSMPELPPR